MIESENAKKEKKIFEEWRAIYEQFRLTMCVNLEIKINLFPAFIYFSSKTAADFINHNERLN